VVDFDFASVPGAEHDPYAAWDRLHAGPDFVWTPHYGGHWIATRAEDIELIQKDYEHFSHRHFILPRGTHPVRLIPLEYDPPEHTGYRALINPAFTPKAVGDLEGEARQLAIELIEEMKPRGGCDFVADFAHHLPVRMFLRMANLPPDKRDQFLDWACTMAHSSDPVIQAQVVKESTAYLTGLIEERLRNPGADMISRVVTGKIDGRPMQLDEMVGFCTILFFGGLDTVASMMGFIALFLARNPGHRKQLIENPALIPAAIEEFLRRFGLSNTARVLAKDFEYKGVSFKKDDMMLVPISMSGMDERRYPNPLAIDFNRKPLHATFGNGVHRCPGSMLARIEIRVFLEEWLKRIPDFSVNPNDKPVTSTGRVNGVVKLPLVWAQ
jgi:cytochrome P450